jgi:hypothetical protein
MDENFGLESEGDFECDLECDFEYKLQCEFVSESELRMHLIDLSEELRYREKERAKRLNA